VKRFRFFGLSGAVAVTFALLAFEVSLPAAKTPTREETLKRLIETHSDSVMLHAELASILLKKGTVRGRMLATRQMRWALRLAPEDPDLHMLLAEIHFEGTFWKKGVGELLEVLKLEPGNGLARARLGKAYIERAVEEWQEKWFWRAAEELRLVDPQCPSGSDACKDLALCLIDLGQPDSSVALLRRLPEDRLDSDALVLLAIAYTEVGDGDHAQETFSRALGTMDEKTRRRYTSIELVATPAERKELAGSNPHDSENVIARLWRKRDPNPATEVNERLIEHLARVGFADLHFSVPRLGKFGSQTDRGEVYVRYGRPLGWFYDPFGSGLVADDTALPRPAHSNPEGVRSASMGEFADPGAFYRSRPLRAAKPRWTWNYKDFSLSFEDVFLNGDFAFPYELDWSAYKYAYLAKQLPEIYVTQIRKRMRVILDAVNFLDRSGKACLKIIYACDTRGVRYIPPFEWPVGEFQVEVAVLDSVYRSIAHSEFETELRADSSVLYQTEYPLIGVYTAHVPPGPSVAAVSLESMTNEAAGFAKDEISVRRFTDSLEMSDVELRFASEGPPNPSHVFLRRDKAYLAFSVYNVVTDDFGTGEIEVGYRIYRRPEVRRTLRHVFELFSSLTRAELAGGLEFFRSGHTVRTGGDRSDQVIGIDLAPLAGGDYEIEVTVTDIGCRKTVTAATHFRIASDLQP
jgi:GWxTD domain-containing protein